MSEEREAFEAWYDNPARDVYIHDKASAYKGWQAARQSAGATGQAPIGYMRPDELAKARIAPNMCRVHPAKDKQSDMVPVYSVPIGDNGENPAMTMPSIAVDPSAPPLTLSPIAQPAESKRVELTDAEIDAVYDSVPWKDLNVASLEHATILRRRFARALLARAQAKEQS